MSLQSNGYEYVGNHTGSTEEGTPAGDMLRKGTAEPLLLRRMREDYRFFGGLSVLYGLVFTFCLYKNLHGVTFPVCVAVTVGFSVLLLRRIEFRVAKRSAPYVAGMVLLGISTAYTSDFFFHFFNSIGIILLFFVFMIRQFYDDAQWDFPGYLKRLLILAGTTAECLQYPVRHGISHAAGNKNEKNRTIVAAGIGIVTAAGLLCVILPLLLKSDMMFSKLFGQLLKYVNFATIIGIGMTFLAGTMLCYGFFAALCKYNLPKEEVRRIKYYHPVTGITFTGIISVIYVLYCLIQIMYLFGRLSIGLPEGVTYAQYARGGFWELLFVGIINFIMVLLCMYLFRDNLALKMILTVISGCTFIMLFSAAYRMILYVGVYHLTFLRVLVLWFLGVLAFIMGGVIVSMYRRSFPLFGYITAVVSVMYILLAFSRPDAAVIRYNLGHVQEKRAEDLEYFLSRSLDCAPEIAKVDLDEYDDREWLEREIDVYFLRIAEEYDDVFLRKANYSEIRAKLAADEYLRGKRPPVTP